MLERLPFWHFFVNHTTGEVGGPFVGVPELVVITAVALITALVPSGKLRNSRKVALIGLLSFAAFITPTPDLITLLYAWTLLYLLFEMAYFIARVARPRVNVLARR